MCVYAYVDFAIVKAVVIVYRRLWNKRTPSLTMALRGDRFPVGIDAIGNICHWSKVVNWNDLINRRRMHI